MYSLYTCKNKDFYEKQCEPEEINSDLIYLHKIADIIINLEKFAVIATKDARRRSCAPRIEPKKKIPCRFGMRKTGDFSIDLSEKKSVVLTHYKQGLFCYFWNRNPDIKISKEPSVEELIKIGEKKDEIFYAILAFIVEWRKNKVIASCVK